MNALQNHPETDYSIVSPILDNAINDLGEADRAAILPRFFEQHDFRSIGKTLGSSEDAARMRVTRALEKLGDFLKQRGITTTAASLSAVLSANAIQIAPSGLAATISSAAVQEAMKLCWSRGFGSRTKFSENSRGRSPLRLSIAAGNGRYPKSNGLFGG